MYLRKATLFIIATTYVCLCAIFYICSNLILIRGLTKLENEYAKSNVERAISALNQKISSLNKTAEDWASWDESYNFANGGNPGFPLSNFMDSTYRNLGINLIIISDRSGSFRAGRAFDLALNKEVPIHSSIFAHVRQIGNTMDLSENSEGTSGIVMVSERPMMIVAKPIRTSMGTGPPAGVLIMGDNMDETDIMELSSVTQLSLVFFNAGGRDMPADARDAFGRMEEGRSVVTSRPDDSFINGYTSVNDIFGKPSMLLKVKMPRGAYSQAKKSIFSFILILMAVGIITAFLIILILERNLLSRLDAIMKGIDSIRDTGNLRKRISLPGNDELSNLSRAIDSMMSSLESSEKQLEESEEKYRNLVELANDGIFITQEQKIKYINPRLSEISGYSQEEVLERPFTDFVHPEEAANVMNEYAGRLLRSDAGQIFETVMKHKSGISIPVEASARVISFNGRPGGLIIIRDITERKKAQELLASEKERLSVTLRSIGDGVITTDTSMNVSIMNRAAEKLTGWRQEEAAGRPLSEVFTIVREKTRENCEDHLRKIMATGMTVELVNQTTLVSRNGSEMAVAVTGAPIKASGTDPLGIVLVFRDITEKRRIDGEISRIHLLDAAGALASGTAHDLNNILTCIIGNLAMAKQGPGPERYRECIGDAERASMQAKEIAQHLLAFSRGSSPRKTRASVREIIRDSAEFILRGSNIKCNYTIPQDLWMVDADPGQISQVVFNIVLNARQAMPEGGIIEISAENAVIDEEHKLPLAFGPYVRIKIKDTGIGIPDEIIPRIFDPFFTTRESSFGLGLTSVKSIVSKHQGMITVDSEVGTGTLLTVYFQAAKNQEFKAREFERDIPVTLGRILVVLGDEEERSALNDILTMLGYDALLASSAEEAFGHLKESKEAGMLCDAVIVDNCTENADLENFSLIIRESMPGVKLVATLSDSTGNAQKRLLILAGFSNFIIKPFRVHNVNEVLQRVMLEIA